MLRFSPKNLEPPPPPAAAAAKSLQSCPTLCDPIEGSPPGSAVPGILQAGTLEWVAIFFSNVWKWKVKGKSLSRVRLFLTPWTAAYQAPLSMGFSRQEYWSGVPLPSPTSSYTLLKANSLTNCSPVCTKGGSKWQKHADWDRLGAGRAIPLGNTKPTLSREILFSLVNIFYLHHWGFWEFPKCPPTSFLVTNIWKIRKDGSFIPQVIKTLRFTPYSTVSGKMVETPDVVTIC